MKKHPRTLTTAQQAEDERETIRLAMSIIGSRTTKKKAATARRNGKKGGRPRKERKT
jgi:hypothetical protein